MCLVALTKKTDCFRRYNRRRANLGVFFRNFVYINELFKEHSSRVPNVKLMFLVPKRTLFFYNRPPKNLPEIFKTTHKEAPGLVYDFFRMYGNTFWGDARVFFTELWRNS